MWSPFLELDCWSIPPAGYVDLLPGEVSPPQRHYRLRFLRDTPTAPTLISVVGTDSPVVMESDDTRDTRFGAALPIKLSANLIVQSHWSPAQVYPVSDSDVQVWLDELPGNGVALPKFRGWLQATAGTERYSNPPYEVAFTAVCGITKLKNRPVVDLTGAYPIGPISRLRLLEGLLAQTGLLLPLTSVCNLTPIIDRIGNPGFDPLSRLYNNGEAFRPPGEDPPSAYEVLNDLCDEMDAELLQWDGRWWFVRVNELPGGWVQAELFPKAEDALVRYYDVPGSTVPPTRKVMSFTRPAGPGYTLRVEDGATTEPQPLTPVLSVEQTFGRPLSRLSNGDFSQPGRLLPAGWERYSDTHGGFSRLGDGKPDNPFRVRIEGSGTNELGLTYPPVGFRQRVMFPPFTRTVPPLQLQGKFRLKNTRSAKIVVWAVVDRKLFTSNGYDRFLLNEDGTWLWNPPRYELYGIEVENINKVGNTITARTEWADFNLALNELSIVGFPATQILYYEIGFCQANALPGAQNPDRWIEYEDAVLTEKVDDTYKGRRYTVTNQAIPASNLRRDKTSTLTLKYADAAFAPIGATTPALLMRNLADTGFELAFGFDKPGVPNEAGTGAPLALWCATERAAQEATTSQRFDGGLVGELPFGPLTLIRFMDWAGLIRVQIGRFSWETAKGRWEVSAQQIRRTSLGQLSAAYLVDGGEIPYTPEAVTGTDKTDIVVIPSPPKTAIPRPINPILPILKQYTGPILWLNSVMPVDTPAEVAVAPRLTVKRGTATLLELSPLVRKSNDPLP